MKTSTAYDACEAITRAEAKNFAYGIRLLAPPERRALSAVYALARRIDDVGDGDDPPEVKAQALCAIREDLTERTRGTQDPVMVAVADAQERYDLPMAAFGELIDGCEQDVAGASYATEEDLVGYCRLVAGSVGRLSLAVFGCSSRTEAEPLADDLGVALQLTNIVRDVREDREMGRVYLPAGDVARFGCAPDLSGPSEQVASLVAFYCQQAERWFDTGLQLLALLDGRSRACVGAMAGIYRRLLHRIQKDPMAVTRGRVSLSGPEKVKVALSALAESRR